MGRSGSGRSGLVAAEGWSIASERLRRWLSSCVVAVLVPYCSEPDYDLRRDRRSPPRTREPWSGAFLLVEL